MKENTEQRLDKLTKKIMSSTKLEAPSSNFTENLMAHIEGLELRQTKQKPLISSLGWLVIGIIITGIVLYNFFFGLQSSGLIDGVNFNLLENNKLSEAISGVTISKTLMYSIVLFGLFMLVQLTVLKNYFDKRLQF